MPRVYKSRSEGRGRNVSAGAGWGNVRYGKGFRTRTAVDTLGRLFPGRQFRKVLDVGANRGSFLLAFASAHSGAELFGIEPDASVIGDYRENPAIRLAVDRVENVALPEMHFDLVYCCHTLEHVADPQSVLHQLRATLAPDGVLYMEVPDIAIVARDDWVEEFFIDKHRYHYSQRTFRAALASSGFEVTHFFGDGENLVAVSRPGATRSPAPDIEEAKRALDLVTHYQTRLKSNRDKLRNAAARISAMGNSRVAVWGAGRIFDSLVTFGGLDPGSVCALFDRELPRYVDRVHGLRVLFPDRLPEVSPEVLVVASRAYFEEIREQALKLTRRPLDVMSVFELMDEQT